jgi:hypothetical protein
MAGDYPKLDSRLVPIRTVPRFSERFVQLVADGALLGRVPVKIDNHERLRNIRVDAGLTLRQAARRIGMSAENLSGLEHGRYTLKDGNWDGLEALLAQKETSHGR